MWFSNLFKSRHQKETERLKKKAEMERASDLGDAASKEIMNILNSFFEQRAEPVSIAMMKIWRERIKETHKQQVSDAVSEFQIVVDEIHKYRKQMFNEARNSLGEWKYTAIEMGIMDLIEKYINAQLDKIVELMNNATRDDAAYAFVRIKGYISDEEDKMSPEELNAHLEKKKQDRIDGGAES
jgi:hypothetical protein